MRPGLRGGSSRRRPRARAPARRRRACSPAPSLAGTTAEVTLAVPDHGLAGRRALRDGHRGGGRPPRGRRRRSRCTKRTMSEDERLALRTALRERMAGVSGPQGQHGHSHGAETPRFLDRSRSTRVLGISLGQGRRGQVVGDGEPRRSRWPRPGKRVGVLDADVYGFSIPKMLGARPRPDHPGRHRAADRRPRRALPVDGLLRPRRPAGDLAGPDAAQGHRAVRHRGLVGRARLPPHRHAAGHRRRGAHALRGAAERRDLRGHHARSRQPSVWPSAPPARRAR